MMAITIAGGPVEIVLFSAMALAAILGALSVILATDPFISALSLILNFAALGTLYLLAGSPFVAIAQVIVYAGAVVVLFLFVMAYLGDRREVLTDNSRLRGLPIAAVAVAVLVGTALTTVILQANLPAGTVSGPKLGNDSNFGYGSAQAIGELFLTKYTLAFEATSVVLLVAAVGGIVLGLTGRARHRKLRKMSGTRSADQQRRLLSPDAEAHSTDSSGGAE